MMPLSELLDDRTFRKYFETTPGLYSTQLNRPAWRVWIQPKAEAPWRRKDVTSYQSGVVAILDRIDRVYDAALQSRGVAYEPPTRRVRVTRSGQQVVRLDRDGVVRPVVKTLVWKPDSSLTQDYGYHLWCFYCRRPTVFAFFTLHHAFKGTSLEGYYTNDQRRCTLCGITESHNRSRI